MTTYRITEAFRQALLSHPEFTLGKHPIEYAILKHLDMIKGECLIEDFYFTFDERVDDEEVQ